jgi:hypothetical protein
MKTMSKANTQFWIITKLRSKRKPTGNKTTILKFKNYELFQGLQKIRRSQNTI